MKQWLKRHLETWITQQWYTLYPTMLATVLLPLSGLMWLVVQMRCWAYRRGWFSSYRSSVPVIVVGNITVGGSGKTPLVLAWVKHLQSRGYKVGVVTRGYGGQMKQAYLITNNDTPYKVGDEPLLLKRSTHCEVCVGRNRAAGVQLLEKSGCQIIISDDGLQHYALQRDVEVGMIDGARQLGNRLLLPAGPLRETGQRLKSLDFVVSTWSYPPSQYESHVTMLLEPTALVPLDERLGRMEPQALNIMPVHAVTAIGHPQRFFMSLRMLGYQIMEHAYPDHDRLTEQHLRFPDEYAVIMTTKDAIKCEKIAGVNEYYLEVKPQLSQDLFRQIDKRLGL